ncbi:hypothetical protein RvY_14714 [Ramazzottius varieornatus]|uniref:Structure-specific endonuclease subunit SLX1 homolog n=1 Tax=Ramazzottius varieornatus TaxID=947166 RepID=A0A1D1W0M2_RAMVA|nr:hypothetical protein RvY_14714 [Ramazzottius varieornatus]
MEQTVENFHGCYLLVSNSENRWYRGRTYIGYTVDPNRRHKQHNKGRKFGGAVRTGPKKGPWDVVVIVYGFMTNIAALQFEWAWQHPDESRRLRSVGKKKSKENALTYRLRLMAEMLSIEPWNNLALTVQWLNSEYEIEFPANLKPPSHIPILSGAVRTKKVTAPETPVCGNVVSLDNTDASIIAIQESPSDTKCGICQLACEKPHRVTCLVTTCSSTYHLICLAKHFLGEDKQSFVPLKGECPSCRSTLLWADLIRFKKGHYRNAVVEMQGASALAEDVHDDDV